MFALKASFFPLNIHHLLPLAFICMGGIWWQAEFGSLCHPLAIGLILIAALCSFRIVPSTGIIFGVCSFVAGALLYQYQYSQHLQFLDLYAHKNISIAAKVTNINPLDHPRFNFCITLQAEQINCGAENPWQPCTKTFQIYSNKKQQLQVDDTIVINNITLKKTPNSSFTNYLIKEGIAATLFVHHIDYQLLARPVHSIARSFFQFKQHLFNRLEEKIPDATFPLFAALFLGNKTLAKSAGEDYPKDDFQVWGISHHLARSGLHMVIFIMLWEIILSMLSCSFAFKQLLLFAISITYFLLSWSSVSFIRAFLTFLLYKGCILLSVPINALHILTIVCLAVLLHNPMQLFFLDFQLSFGLTFALAWFNHAQLPLKKA